MNFQSILMVRLTHMVNTHKNGALAEKNYTLVTCIAEETEFSDPRNDESTMEGKIHNQMIKS